MLTVENGLFVWQGDFYTKDIPKAAGFRWHGGNCYRNCEACKAGLRLKVWWSGKSEQAARIADHADDKAKVLLAEHIQAVEASKAVDADIEVPCPEGLAYLPFQRAGIAYAISKPSTLFADQMGLGKTVQALGTINALGGAKSVLVICPASLRLNWLRESQKWLTGQWSFYVVDSNDPIPEYADFVIANYERIRGAKNRHHYDAIMARQWDILIIDEVHRIKNRNAQGTEAILGVPKEKKKKVKDKTTGEKIEVRIPPQPGIIDRGARKLFLTGTPFLNKPVEIHPLLASLAPQEFGNFFTFARRYCGAKKVQVGRNKYVWDMTGATNLSELQEKLRATLMVRRLKKDVLTELPPKRRQIIVFPANGSTAKIKAEQVEWSKYKGQIEELEEAAEMAEAIGDEEEYNKIIAKLEACEKVAFENTSAVRRELAVAKVPLVVDYVEDMFEQGIEKIVIFGHHNEVCDKMAEHFGDAAVKLTGKVTSDRERQAAVDRFQTDPTCKVFVGSIGAAGVGHTLTAASDVVFAELDWVPANISQAEDRCHRIGQHNMVNVRHLVVEGSMDVVIAEKVIKKQDMADAALDADTKVTATEMERPKQKDGNKYPRVSDPVRQAAHEAMRALAGVCDGAIEKDGMGFNGLDTRFGKKLAMLPTLTDGQAWAAQRLARKYHRQLDDRILSVLGISRK